MIFDILRPKNARICAGTLRGLMGGSREEEGKPIFHREKVQKVHSYLPTKSQNSKIQDDSADFPSFDTFLSLAIYPDLEREEEEEVNDW